MMCMEPADLIRKYTRYPCGDPKSADRRIVLDESMMEHVNDILICNGEDLLSTFLAYVQAAREKAKGSNRPILLLVFGHCAESSFSVSIGGIGGTCSRLEPEDLKTALFQHNPSPNVTMMTTSRYGGGWLQITSLSPITLVDIINNGRIGSWSRSTFMHTPCDSRDAREVAKALMEDIILDLDFRRDEDEAMLHTPEFETLVENVREVLVREVDAPENNNISFSAEHDIWDETWQGRIGFSLSTFQEKWQNLKPLQKCTLERSRL